MRFQPVRLAGVTVKNLSITEAIKDAARRAWATGRSPNCVFVSPQKYIWLQTWSDSIQVEDAINASAKTYERRTTLLAMLHAAWRMHERKNRRFYPLAWWRRVTEPSSEVPK